MFRENMAREYIDVTEEEAAAGDAILESKVGLHICMYVCMYVRCMACMYVRCMHVRCMYVRCVADLESKVGIQIVFGIHQAYIR